MKKEEFRNFVYNVENIVDEAAIVLLSLGALVVTVYSFFFVSQDPGLNFIEFGRVIFPWFTMLSLMIIGRELWIMNRKITSYLQREGEN